MLDGQTIWLAAIAIAMHVLRAVAWEALRLASAVVALRAETKARQDLAFRVLDRLRRRRDDDHG